MVRVRRFAALAGAVVALSLLVAPASLAASRTTQPGKTVLVYFVFTDNKLAYEIFRQTQGGGSETLFLEKYVVRGDFAKVIVINRSKKPHGFVFMGHKIRDLEPGRKVRFSAALLRRGGFPYRSTTDSGKAYRGVFPVY